jgi:CHAD domain-containing protein
MRPQIPAATAQPVHAHSFDHSCLAFQQPRYNMAFELQSDQKLGKGTRRIARGQMEKALEMLSGKSGESRSEAVHEARKCFKKIRAVLRLVRPWSGDAAYRRENRAFRDAGRPLTEVRDTKILIETLDKLIEHFAGRSFDEVREELQADRRAVQRRVLEKEGAEAIVAAAVRAGCRRLEQWTDLPNRWPVVGDGLKQTYKKASEAFAEATADPTDENLHECRKQVKYLRYQLEIMRPAWPELMDDLVEQVDRMGQLLGDDHDLVVLRQKLASDPDRFGGASTVETLVALMDRRRTELQHEAKLLGERLLTEPPKEFAGRIKAYWKAWCTESAEPPLVEAAQPAAT